MKNVYKFIGLIFMLYALSFPKTVYSQKIQVFPPSGWQLDLTGEITEAGINFTGPYVSASNQLEIRIFGAANVAWRVDVSFELIVSPSPEPIISVRRSANGTPQSTGATLSGGDVAVPVSVVPDLFFSGYGNWNDIPIELSMSNASVEMDASVYSWEIVFTVSQVP